MNIRLFLILFLAILPCALHAESTGPAAANAQGDASVKYVNVIGEVNSHGARIPYTADMTLMAAITAAGGFTDFADKKRVELMRDGKVVTYDTKKISNGKTDDPKVLPGDKITVYQLAGR